MFGKLSVLLVIGFASFVSASSDLSVAKGEKLFLEASDEVNEVPKTSVGAFPAGFLGTSQLVTNNVDKQWLYDQLPSGAQGRPGTLRYRNGDSLRFTQAISNKRSVLFIAQHSENNSIFGGFTQAQLRFEAGKTLSYFDTTSFLYTLNNNNRAWKCAVAR
jgi:hypothetical protein